MTKMTSPKVAAGRSTGLRCMVWGIGSILFVMCIQLWVYERKWFEQRHPDDDDSGTSTFRIRHSPLRLVDGVDENPHDVVRVIDESTSLREILDAITGCIPDPSAQVEADTAECLQKLVAEFPALTALQLPLRFAESSSSTDRNLIKALENQIANLSQMLGSSIYFMELKDIRESGQSDTESHWFMSSLKGSPDKQNGFPEEFQFPSELSNGRILCFLGNSTRDGTMNKYGFAYKGYLPPGSTLLPGLTLVADNYWDYTNIWHGMSALVNFVAISARENCVVPTRVLLFHQGELVPSMGTWVEELLHASFGRRLEIEKFDHQGGGPVCLERAIVNRRGLGGMSVSNMNVLFDTIRCRARKFCAVVVPQTNNSQQQQHSRITITLLLRSGARALKNATAAQEVIARVCRKLDNCQLEVSYLVSLTFCQQVALMSRTDVLVSTHGAQLTNMMFMSKGSYVMEMMPKGWEEFAGVGQRIYTWLASWTSVNHEGIWHDPQGPDCPDPATETLKCFLFFKDSTVGHNETHLADWTSKTLQKAIEQRKNELTAPDSNRKSIEPCTCDQVHKSEQQEASHTHIEEKGRS